MIGEPFTMTVAANAMADGEIRAGRWVLRPGDRYWFTVADWMRASVISIDPVLEEVRIVAVAASTPGRGAFRRLLQGIYAVRMRPVVVEPFNEMTEILQRWGWVCQLSGFGLEREECWRPPEGWRPHA